MDKLSGLFKTVLYRVIFNSLVGVAALLLILFLINNAVNGVNQQEQIMVIFSHNVFNGSISKQRENYSLLHYYLTNIWIILLLITVIGEILCSFGEMVTNVFFNFNSLIKDNAMEFISPQCSEDDDIGNNMSYKNFVKMLNSGQTATEFSEINFVLGRVFAGFGIISLIITFYYWHYSLKILLINYVVIYFIVFIFFTVFIFKYIKSLNCNKKIIINTIMLAVTIIVVLLIACTLKNIKNINYHCISLLFFLSTVLFFYISILYKSFANKLNKEISNSNCKLILFVYIFLINKFLTQSSLIGHNYSALIFNAM